MNATLPQGKPQFRAPPGIECVDDTSVCRTFASDGDSQQGYAPQAVLKPHGTDDILALLKWANESGTGVVPVSSTGRRRRGDTVPTGEKIVIADLSGMKRLVHADARDKIVIIEPGVDFGAIDKLLEPHALRAFRPLFPRAGKSVIASYLEREPLIAANDHWDAGDPFGGTAVVLGNGRYAPTGGAAIEGTLEEQLARGHRHMMPVGPINLDILRVLQGAQGSLGVMSWAAVYCERIPSMEAGWFACADQPEPVLDLARDLLHRRLGNALFIVDRLQLAMLLAGDKKDFESLARTLPAWTLFVSVAAGRKAPDEKMAWQRADVQDCAARHGVALHETLEGRSAASLMRQLRQPEPVSFRDRPLGAHRELFFLQQLDRATAFEPVVREALVKSGLDPAPLGMYIQPMAQGVYCHVEFTLPYDPADTVNAARSTVAWREAAQRCADAGAFFSRPYGEWSALAYRSDPGILPLMNMTKSIFDPNGVMNPGRLPY